MVDRCEGQGGLAAVPPAMLGIEAGKTFSVSTLAKRLCVAPRSVHRLRSSGRKGANGVRVRLRGYMVGGRWRFSGADVLEFLAATQPAEEMPHEPRPARAYTPRDQDIDRLLDLEGF